ncbi:MAG: UbiA-like polyprenyltransferase [Calditrichaceae bacterium]
MFIKFIRNIIEFGQMIKFSHSVFALPFALSGAILADQKVALTWPVLMWILVAMIAARSAAMGFNRLIDKKFDAKNPRTKNRHLPSGKITERQISIFILFFSGLFIYASYELNMLCFILSPVALAVVFLYSYTKRFTSLSHYVLGIALGLSPIGAWLAVTGYFAWAPVLLSLAVVFWVAGFDIVYSCQDIDFDKKSGLFSVPKLVGLKNSLMLARLSHLISFLLLAYLAWLVPLNFIYTAGLIIIAGLLTYEHSLVKSDNLAELDVAFFNMNGFISIVFFVSVIGDLWLL